MSLLDGFLQQLTTGDTVKDWKHASKLFVGDNFRLSPKMGFLYHVFFDLDPQITEIGAASREVTEAGMLVKSVDLPKFTVETKTLNSYNKPNIVQNKVKYDTVNLSFHDDSADVVQTLWADYYTYYYRDMDGSTDKGLVGQSYSQNNKYGERKNSYGFTPRIDSKEKTNQFIRAIRIYSLHQKKFTEYILVNPIITSFKHGQHVAGSSDPMQCDMTIAYEFVLYCTGAVSSNTVKGFADLHYDKSKSSLSPVNGTQSIMGQGGIFDTANSVISSLPQDPAGALFKASRGLKNASAMNLKGAIFNELTQYGMDILRGGTNPLNGIAIPSVSDSTSRVNAEQNASVDAAPTFSWSSAFSNGASIASSMLPGNAGTALTAAVAGAQYLGKKITAQTSTDTTAPSTGTNAAPEVKPPTESA